MRKTKEDKIILADYAEGCVDHQNWQLELGTQAVHCQASSRYWLAREGVKLNRRRYSSVGGVKKKGHRPRLRRD